MARGNITYQLFLVGRTRRPVFTIICPCGSTFNTPSALTERDAEAEAKRIAGQHNREQQHGYLLRKIA